ncbi:glycosyltransferase family 2 protein [Actinokineospora sp. NBRC 105648]|uniref:glycosyltransferase family 2 protein n=1 Tax=Actinokineospora sp. NBRC 105648 TaxID=3032206 RepID=UPI0024A5FC05|nr:glycosyltransferase family 2 protein [Actinokineospora sp. NBRC 105648]GLZ42643.1 glycosyl transferase family A [Actinokineospora sp. NBRC 105648]
MTGTAVITITHRRDDHLRRQRLGLAADPPDLHVIVAMDDVPEVDPVPGLETVLVHVGASERGLPLAAARNAGAAAALAAGVELLVFLDVDCIPGPSLVSRYADVRVSGPALLCGPVAYLPPAADYPVSGLSELAEMHPGRPAPDPGVVLVEKRFELFWSLSFAVRAGDWAALGGFFEGYVGYGAEDTDFALTWAAGGAGLYWVGGAEAYHQYHPPTRLDPGRAGEIVRNCWTFRERQGYWPMRSWLDELAALGIVEFDGVDVLRIV